MAAILKRVVPRSVFESLAVLRAYRRSQKLDRRFKAERQAFTMNPRLFADLTVLPTRRELMEHVPKGGTIAEIGVADGSFSTTILDVCQPKKLYLIDLWPAATRYARMKEVVEDRFQLQIRSGMAEILLGVSWEIVGRLPDESLDLAYVDAAHDFDSVQRDLEACRRKVKAEGMICGDDYSRWSSNGLHRWGVVEAVNRFCNEHRWEMVFLTHEPGRHINYGLRRAEK